MPRVLKESGVVFLPEVAKRVAIEDISAFVAVGEASKKILQGCGIWESGASISEIEQAPACGMVAQVRPEEQRLRAKLEGMLAAQEGDVIHNIIVFARAVVFRQILIAAQLREITDLNRGESAQERIRHARIDAISAQRCVDVVYVVDALMLIPAEPQIVYPSGIRCPGPAHGDELGPALCSISKLRLCDSRARVA